MNNRNVNIPIKDGNDAAPKKTGRETEEIRCSIEQVTFRNDVTLYTVLKAKNHESQHIFTAVGELPLCSRGEDFLFEGAWHDHPKYGLQLRISRATPLPPSTLEGIERYLASSDIHGIGRGFAGKIVRKFGKKTLEVIEKEPEKLLKIKGFGQNRLRKIVEFFRQREHERNIMLFLYSHGITPAYAGKIIRRYKMESINVIKENPYRLADDIFGIGFKLADRLAMNLGIRGNAPERIRAAILYGLSEAESEGHCFLTKEQLIEYTTSAISVDISDVEKRVNEMLRGGELVSVTASNLKETFEPQDCIYTRNLFTVETEAVSRMRALLGRLPVKTAAIEVDREIVTTEKKLNISFAVKQKEAIIKTITEKVTIITGGPGTGKTTIVRAIVSIYKKFGKSVLLCAPTGRAAKRLSAATGHTAKTIHRLMRWNAAARTFDFCEENPLKCDLLIVDETSMVDIRLFNHLLRALTPETRLLIVGDSDQLPSVGPGSVLRDIIKSGVIPATRLDEIFRQAAASMIISNAHRINKGTMPALQPDENQTQDFYFIDRSEPEEIADTILEMVVSRIPSKYSLHPLSGIQVLAPMHKGVMGVKNLNERLSKSLNGEGRRISGLSEPISVGDKVMQIKNNYDLDVFNGDIGIVVDSDMEERIITVNYDGRFVKYGYDNTDELVKAYAISIHKSQGSEYDAVVVPVSTSHYIMLQRNLIYTAITRARKLVVLVGTKKALAIAIKNDRVRERNTLLAQFLSEEITL